MRKGSFGTQRSSENLKWGFACAFSHPFQPKSKRPFLCFEQQFQNGGPGQGFLSYVMIFHDLAKKVLPVLFTASFFWLMFYQFDNSVTRRSQLRLITPQSKFGRSLLGQMVSNQTANETILRELPDQDDVAQFMIEREKLYAGRRQRIRMVCQKYGHVLHRSDPKIINTLMVSKENQLGYCRHGKVGTSTWMHYFLDMANSEALRNLSTRTGLHTFIPKYFRLPQDTRLKTYLNDNPLLLVTFVRHPFERLVSAYENKIKYFRDKAFLAIRENIGRMFGNLSFLSFIKFILRELTTSCTLASCEVNVHWRPFYDRCAYCDMDYDVIGTLDEFQADIFYINQRIHLPGVFNLTLQANSSPEISNQLTRHEKTLQYFKQLQKTQIVMLLRIYRVDFELFGFTADEYLK